MREKLYAETLSKMIQAETISAYNQADEEKFQNFRTLLSTLFPTVFSTCEVENFDGAILLKWQGKSHSNPVLFMNHHDVVEATGSWKYPPFSGEIAEGKVWGRGTVDDKGPLFAMLESAEELMKSGFIPETDIYFETTRSEETDGKGSNDISKTLESRGIRFKFVLDEGGEIVYDPIGGAKGYFAMIGVGEKGLATLKFTARSRGGHSSTPPKNSPLVRLGKFMAECDNKPLFKAEFSDCLIKMLKGLAPYMSGLKKFVFSHPKACKGILKPVFSSMPTANAMIRTTVAFTMAGGSEQDNVLPENAFVIANMRLSPMFTKEESYSAIKKIADKYGLETEILEDGMVVPSSKVDGEEFAVLCDTVKETFPSVTPLPYVMNGASDSRFFSRVSENCFRFAPFTVTDKQIESIHGIDENIDISTLVPAVDFYKNLMKKL